MSHVLCSGGGRICPYNLNSIRSHVSATYRLSALSVVAVQKEHKNGVMSPESPEQDTEYTLTPRTEAKYSKIDEDFQIIMQRNHQMSTAAGQQRVMSANSNYTMPVTVPIPGSYGESAMLQASPQMTHPNISPRPSSSETDSGRFAYIFVVPFVVHAEKIAAHQNSIPSDQ